MPSGASGSRPLVSNRCNDGILIAPLEKLGISAKGVDISENITEMARAKGLDVTTGFFDDEMARSLVQKHGPADVVTGSNAFAHNDHPERILSAARLALKDSGHLCLEVMYAGDLLELLQWDTLYHEHLTFYSLRTLEVLLKRYGFHLVHAERSPSWRIAALHAPPSPEAALPQWVECRYEEKLAWRIRYLYRFRRTLRKTTTSFSTLVACRRTAGLDMARGSEPCG